MIRQTAPAIGALVGARAAVDLPGWAVLLVVAAALLLGVLGRATPAIVMVVAALASVLAVRALAPLGVPIEEGAVDGVAVLVADPRERGRSTRVDVRHDGHRYELSAHGGVAAILAEARMGERVLVRGHIERGRPGDERWFRPRHVVGRIEAERVSRPIPAPGPIGAANDVRELLAGGASSLDRDDRALFLGLSIGDDRDQTDEVRDRFRDAGLGHLLVVSGQNVAFVLAVVAPVLARLPPASRAVAAIAVLLFFVAVTRVEPSVSRAAVMAGLAVGAELVGRPTSSLRLLSTAVTGLVLVDPLLAWSLAFQLSAAATLGIVLLEAPIRRALPGPRWATVPLSVTLAAQLGVAPLLVATFGDVPSASLPANLLAGPVAGAVMVWGVTAGLVAGVVPDPLAAVLHLPTLVGVRWIDGVARVTTSWGLPPLGGPELVAAVAVGWSVGRRRGERRERSVARRRLGQARGAGEELDRTKPFLE
ncbi:MAG: ComEC/Rec2 family competence protein [Actinomycetota bacterium]